MLDRFAELWRLALRDAGVACRGQVVPENHVLVVDHELTAIRRDDRCVLAHHYILFSTNRAPVDGPAVDIIADASDHDMVISSVSMMKTSEPVFKFSSAVDLAVLAFERGDGKSAARWIASARSELGRASALVSSDAASLSKPLDLLDARAEDADRDPCGAH